MASRFFEHKHHEDARLKRCNLIVCWNNDIKHKTVNENGKEYLGIQGHRIEVLALKDVVQELEKEKIHLILKGKRPGLQKANERNFFEQLKSNVAEEKSSLIEELYNFVKTFDEFYVGWGRGHKWYTMKLYVRKWGVRPIEVMANGQVYIVYQENPVISPWKLPENIANKLRQLFGHKTQKWPTAPLNNSEDLEKIKQAIKLIAKFSYNYELEWNKK